MVTELLQPITTWLHTHPHVAIVFAGFVAFLESLAIIGSIVPGSVTLTAIGVLIGSGVIPVTETFIAAIIGAILGDTVSYGIGNYYQDSIRNRWPFSQHPALIDRGEAFFYRHGGKSIAIGRFFGPIRAVLPLVAGMLNMPFGRFLLADVVSGIFWAPAYMLPGVLVGAATLELAPEQATWLMLLVLGCLIAVWLLVLSVRRFSFLIVNTVDRLSLRAWLFIRRHRSFTFFVWCLNNPKRARQHIQLVRLTGIMLCTALLCVLTSSIIHHGILTHWNQPVHALLHNTRNELLDEIMVALTLLGDKLFIATFVTILGVVFLLRRQFSLSLYWFANAALVTLLAYFMKHGINNPRPDGVLVMRATSSFPSFHAAFATAVYSFLGFLTIQRRGPRWRRIIIWVEIGLLFLIGLSRLYLGAHWLTDVMAGYLLGLTCGLTLLMAYNRCPFHEPKEIMHLWWAYAFSLFMSYCAVAYSLYPLELYRNQAYYPQHTLSFTEWWQQTEPILPKYRRFRDGTPAVLFNLQWLGEHSSIIHSLQKAGWQQAEQPTLLVSLSRLMAKDKAQTLPVLPPLFEAQYPSLTLIKSIGKNKPLLVLRLWHANYQIPGQPTLWLGTVHYRLLWHHRFLPRYQRYLPDLPSADDILLQSLPGTTTRHLAVKTEYPLHYSIDKNHHQILLLRQN